MSPAGFEIKPANERPENHALGRAVTVIGKPQNVFSLQGEILFQYILGISISA